MPIHHPITIRAVTGGFILNTKTGEQVFTQIEDALDVIRVALQFPETSEPQQLNG